MNWWKGSAEDSRRQASDRDSRAARRTINALPVVASDSDDDFGDAQTSFSKGNVDGNDDLTDSEEDMVDAAAAAELARQRAMPVEDADFEDDADSWKKELKIKFDPDVDYWFNAIEAQMKKYGINSQWEKKNAIVPMLPDDIIDELKPLLRLKQQEAGHIYKSVKAEIIQLYGP